MGFNLELPILEVPGSLLLSLCFLLLQIAPDCFHNLYLLSVVNAPPRLKPICPNSRPRYCPLPVFGFLDRDNCTRGRPSSYLNQLSLSFPFLFFFCRGILSLPGNVVHEQRCFVAWRALFVPSKPLSNPPCQKRSP